MQTIPGVGPVTAFALTAELGNLKKYTRQGKRPFSTSLKPKIKV